MKRTDYEYTVHPYVDGESEPGTNAVKIEVQPGSATEPVHVISDITLRVQRLGGEGEVVIYGADGQRRILDMPQISETPVTIGSGDTYQYLDTGRGDEPFSILDRCTPAFKEGDEASLGVFGGDDDQLRQGDYLVVWNRREPRQRYLAGVLRLAFLEEHDTSAQNGVRTDQAKFVGEPSHWHAMAQRAGEQDIWPVNVRLEEGVVSVAPHRRATDAIIGTPPTFQLQVDPLIFRRVEEQG